MPRPPQSPPVESPFARLLTREWAWKQDPPLTSPAAIARALGLRSGTVWQWLKKGTRPGADVLPGIAEKTGLPLHDLYRAAGYTTPPLPVVPAALWDQLLAEVRDDPRLTDEARAVLLAHLAQNRRDFEAAIAAAEATSAPGARPGVSSGRRDRRQVT